MQIIVQLALLAYSVHTSTHKHTLYSTVYASVAVPNAQYSLHFVLSITTIYFCYYNYIG
jgi:hypothetical protein